jgi:hypothetical protein
MKSKNLKTLSARLLALCMVLTLLPITAMPAVARNEAPVGVTQLPYLIGNFPGVIDIDLENPDAVRVGDLYYLLINGKFTQNVSYTDTHLDAFLNHVPGDANSQSTFRTFSLFWNLRSISILATGNTFCYMRYSEGGLLGNVTDATSAMMFENGSNHMFVNSHPIYADVEYYDGNQWTSSPVATVGNTSVKSQLDARLSEILGESISATPADYGKLWRVRNRTDINQVVGWKTADARRQYFDIEYESSFPVYVRETGFSDAGGDAYTAVYWYPSLAAALGDGEFNGAAAGQTVVVTQPYDNDSNLIIPDGVVIDFADNVTGTGSIRRDGAAITAPAVFASKTHKSITVTAAEMDETLIPGDQTIEYAISKDGDDAPETGWQAGLTFSDLDPGAEYYVWARTAAGTGHGAYKAGEAEASAMIKTDEPPLITASASWTFPAIADDSIRLADFEYVRYEKIVEEYRKAGTDTAEMVAYITVDGVFGVDFDEILVDTDPWTFDYVIEGGKTYIAFPFVFASYDGGWTVEQNPTFALEFKSEGFQVSTLTIDGFDELRVPIVVPTVTAGFSFTTFPEGSGLDRQTKFEYVPYKLVEEYRQGTGNTAEMIAYITVSGEFGVDFDEIKIIGTPTSWLTDPAVDWFTGDNGEIKRLNITGGETYLAFPFIFANYTGGTWAFTERWSNGEFDLVFLLEGFEVGELKIGGFNELIVPVTTPQYTVTFVGWLGALLEADTVDRLAAATAPAVTGHPRTHRFSHWNVPFDSITGDLVVTAVYKPVLYGDIDGDGTINSADVTLLRRYVAAENKAVFLEDNTFDLEAAYVLGQEKIGAEEITMLRRWIATAGDKPALGFTIPQA